VNEGEKTRCGFVAVIGAPNAGKSTLINQIVGSKVSIVSPKVQTTRTRVLGIVSQNNTQIIFVDTPGIFKPDKRKALERAIVSAAWEGVHDADILMLVVDATKSAGKAREIIDQIKENKVECFLVLNKVDKTRPQGLLKLSKDLNDLHDFKATFMVSALKGSGVSDILKTLSESLPDGPFHYPEDQVSDMPMRLLSAEITREKLFHKLHQELPYALTVETEEWESFDNGDVRLEQTIYVSRDNHKGIVLGKGGSLVKVVGEQSRKELQDILETKVHLKLFVKVRENWMNDPERFSLWGLNHNNE